MKLSEQLKQDDQCGDFGKGLAGLPEKALALENLIEEILNVLEPTYVMSPQGCDYLKKARKILSGELE